MRPCGSKRAELESSHYSNSFLLNNQLKFIGAEDAAVAEAAGLTGGGEHHEASTESALVGIDGEGDAFLTTDAVAVGGGDIPDSPGDTLRNLFIFTI